MEFFQHIKRDSGCASYLVGSRGAATCVVIDPAWSVEVYVEAARTRGLRISHIIETHAHADHLSGARRLAAATGAAICAHPEFQARYRVQHLGDGEALRLGEVTVTTWYTPGHRPDGLSLLVTDTARSGQPWMVLTGDTLFVGDVGRPDIGQQPQKAAAELYVSLFDKLLTLPDWTEVYPAHVGGSLCGRDMSSKGGSTIGFERRFNPALQAASSREFVEALTRRLTPQPPNFQVLLQKNRGVMPVRDAPVPGLSPAEVKAKQDKGSLVVDLRSPAVYGEGHIPASLNVAQRQGGFALAAGWSIPAEEPLLLVVERPEQVQQAADSLRGLGLDWIEGSLEGGIPAWTEAGLPTERLPQITVEGLAAEGLGGGGPLVVDVRDRETWEAAHIPNSISIPFEALDGRLNELERARPVAVVCAAGFKSSAAASKLKALGYQVRNVAGGMTAWTKAALPTEAKDGSH